MIPNKKDYLVAEVNELKKTWPDNQTMNIVCHGHSITCGYTVNSVVRMRDAYPHLLHEILCLRYPMAVTNVIITAIGGEAAVPGAKRFQEVLRHKPSIITIDYARNDMYYPLEEVEAAWRSMIEEGLRENKKLILITPVPDCGQLYYDITKRRSSDDDLAYLISRLATEYEVGLADAAGAFSRKIAAGAVVSEYMISSNHLNKAGHEIVANEIMQWFPY
jgi:lysophospholipase L1-like esterase